MKPYGRTKKIKDNLVDNHPSKGYINWWEDEMNTVNKKTERQNAKKHIKREIERYGE